MKINDIRTVAVCALAGAALIATSAVAQLWNQPTLMKGVTGGGGGGGPIAFVAAASQGINGLGTVWNSSYSVSTGSNEGLVICVYTGSGAGSIVSMSYNGISGVALLATTSGIAPEEEWFIPLGNTTAGSHTLTITYANPGNVIAVVGEYAKIQQNTTPDGSAISLNTGGTPGSAAVTTTTSGDWVAVCGVATATTSAGTGLVKRIDAQPTSIDPNLYDSNGTVSVGSNTFTANPSTQDLLAAGFRPG